MLTELLGLGNCALAFRCLPGVSVFASRRSWFSLRRNDKIVRYKCGTCVVSFVASDCSSRGLRDAQKAQGSSVRACVRALRRRASRTHTGATPSLVQVPEVNYHPVPAPGTSVSQQKKPRKKPPKKIGDMTDVRRIFFFSSLEPSIVFWLWPERRGKEFGAGDPTADGARRAR